MISNFLATRTEYFQLFTTVFTMAMLIKLVSEHWRGYQRYFTPSSYLYFAFTTQAKPRLIAWIFTPTMYQFVYWARFLCVILCLIGFHENVFFGLLALLFLYEMTIYFKFHTNYFALICACLAFKSVDVDLLRTLAWMWGATPDASAPANEFLAAALIKMTTVALYLFSGIRKIAAPDFRAGFTLWSTIHYLNIESERRPVRFDFIRSIYDKIRSKAACRALSLGVIGVELVLPALLAYPPSQRCGFFIGVLMHVGFTTLLPITLAHFSLATVSTYLLFL